MFNSFNTPARDYAKGIGDAVADRTINRKREDGSVERWQDVALRVAVGNTELVQGGDLSEFHKMHHHLRQASLLMSGRHLQHGDSAQPTRNMEVFTNCATAASTALTFYLLLNGSGVGRCYDDDMIVTDLGMMPIVIPVIDSHHQDVQSGEILFPTYKDVQHVYAGRKQEYFRVPDSREGWAKAIELIETMAFEGHRRDEVLILDFSDVRPRGAPIMGMQGRPASGPCPLMVAIANIAKLRDAGMPRWRAAMYADHYAAECVLVGGARRAARMATKTWRDPDILDFIAIKKGGFLWSANNSVTVDAEFWNLVRLVRDRRTHLHNGVAARANKVFDAICEHAYNDGTGEPGIINVDRLSWSDEGIDALADGNFAESARYKLSPMAIEMNSAVAQRWGAKPFKAITNPCGEIVLGALGGYCVIADVVPLHSAPKVEGPGTFTDQDLIKWDADAEDAFRTAVRALMRTNLMDSLYSKEVKRTNRIGVGFTGIHEYAWARFGLGWKDLIDEEKSWQFWMMMSRFASAVDDEARKYAAKLGVTVPHTTRTVKPAGTTSKLFGLTEGAHLPSMREYMRWVQFRNDDPLIEEYRGKGYPVRKLKTYSGTTIVGFPTQPTICTLGMGDKLVTAAEATPEEQYRWLALLEKHWVGGQGGNQVSYTLKYDPKLVSLDQFKATLLEGQSQVKCCSVMPQTDNTAYEYQPEQAVTKHEFELVAQAISEGAREDASLEHVDCASGACPVDFSDRKVA